MGLGRLRIWEPGSGRRGREGPQGGWAGPGKNGLVRRHLGRSHREAGSRTRTRVSNLRNPPADAHRLLPSQFDLLEMDRLERPLVNLPLLLDPSSYVPDTVDLTDDALARKYWLTCFEEALDGVRARGGPGAPGDKRRASLETQGSRGTSDRCGGRGGVRSSGRGLGVGV